MHLRELNYIVTLADEKSISRAAERLYMAQSSLSQFLQQYESELGVMLFVRTSRGIRLTSAGELFVENAKSILTHYRLVQNELSDMAELKTGSIIFGVSSFRGRYMLPKILKRFYKKYPNIQVDIVEANSMALEDKIIDGSIDLAVVALPLTKLTHEVELLRQDEIVIVANREHPVMQHVHSYEETQNDAEFHENRRYCDGWVELSDTAGFEYILSDYDTILGSISRKQFQKAGINVISHNTNITADMGAAMAREGLGLAFTYRSCIEPYENVSYLSIGNKGVFLDLALAYPYANYRPKAAVELGQAVKEFMEVL